MTTTPTLGELKGAVVVLRDPAGRRARFTIDRVVDQTAVCTYVFRGRHDPPVSCRPGDMIELGAAAVDGWLTALATVESVGVQGKVVVEVDEIQVVQRRQSYREEVVIPFAIGGAFDHDLRKGRTSNLSIGGFAGKVAGTPIPDGAQTTVVFAMPEGDAVKVSAEKIAGDLQQRFAFVDMHRSIEERFARIVRTAELERRRARRRIER